MTAWLWPDWRAMLALDLPILESVLRGVFIYAGLFVLLRVVARREAGSISLSDLLLVNLVVEAVSNGLQGEARSVPSALLTGATTVGCAYAVDWLSYHWRWFGRLTDPPAKSLIRDGKLRHRTMQEELITRDELEAQVRLNGLEGLHEVRHARIEGDGQISVVAKDRPEVERSARPRVRSGEETLQRLWQLQRELAAQQAKIEAALQELMLQPEK